jgi:hypothetical protein
LKERKCKKAFFKSTLAIKTVLYFVLKYNSRLDEDWMRKKEESGFAPKDRPKKWRQECKKTIKQIIENK